MHGRGYFENIILIIKVIMRAKSRKELQSPANMVKSSILGMSALESRADNMCQSPVLKDGIKAQQVGERDPLIPLPSSL